MGNCNSKSVNCTLSDEPVQADPDVAGIGVCIQSINSLTLLKSRSTDRKSRY